METSPQGQEAADAEHLAGRRDTLRLLGLSGLGALAALSQTAPVQAESQTREQRRRERRQRREKRSATAQAEKKKRGGTPGPTGPTGPTGPAGGAPGPTGPTGPQALSGAVSDYVQAGSSVTLTDFGNLPTPGPSVTVDVPQSGQVLVILTATMVLQTPTTGCSMSFETSLGEGNYLPDRSRSVSVATNSNLLDATLSSVVALTGMSPGPHTFTAKYRKFLGGVGTDPFCSDRSLVVIPLP
ncbi:MAG: hypothetical protein R2853_10950 [Thermomicrobiales bacterium]